VPLHVVRSHHRRAVSGPSPLVVPQIEVRQFDLLIEIERGEPVDLARALRPCGA
jgi:hypothetical protein